MTRKPAKPMRPPTPDHAHAAQSFARGQYEKATAHAQAALRVTPGDAYMHMVLAMALERRGREDAALPHAEKAASLQPRDPRVLGVLGMVLYRVRRFDEALAAIDRALAIDPRDAQALNRKTDIFIAQGRAADAIELLRPVVASQDPPEPGSVLAFARVAKSDSDRALAQARLETLLARPGIAPVTQTAIRHRLADIYDRLDRQADAWKLLTRHTPPVPLGVVHDINTLRSRWTRAAIERIPPANDPDERPVLVVGMPRSGTSLVEQIIGAHPDAAGAGEVTTLLRLAHDVERSPAPPRAEGLAKWRSAYMEQLQTLAGRNADRLVDKLPLNALAIGMAARALPGVRVVYCLRDPRDVCLSCLFKNFDNRNRYTLDPVLCAREFNAVHHAMLHWQSVTDVPIHTVRHEDLVADPEPHIRALIGFLGLPWDDRCLRPHEAQTTVQTASSEQVRSPINAKGVGRWRRYKTHLAPTIDELTRLGLLDDAGVFTP
ncbi:MAG: sulfotransferase [Planctomycetota bacterium]